MSWTAVPLDSDDCWRIQEEEDINTEKNKYELLREAKIARNKACFQAVEEAPNELWVTLLLYNPICVL